jgi:hypothetical protein
MTGTMLDPASDESFVKALNPVRDSRHTVSEPDQHCCLGVWTTSSAARNNEQWSHCSSESFFQENSSTLHHDPYSSIIRDPPAVEATQQCETPPEGMVK